MAVNFTCSGPVVPAYIRDDPSVVLTSRGVKLVPPDDCEAKIKSGCIIALCSAQPPIIIDQGSQLVDVNSKWATLCIGGKASVSIHGVVVANNTAPPGLAATAPVCFAGNSKVTLAGCQFLNNHYALCVHWSWSKVIITNCTFSGNYAFTQSYGGGAAIYAQAADVMEISNSTFFNNSGTGVASGGGAIYTATNMTLHTVTFVDNYLIGAMTGGGAIWVDHSVGIMFRDVNFTGNWVRGDASEGGAIYMRNNSAVSVVGGSFQRNQAIGERSRGELGGWHLGRCSHACGPVPATLTFLLLPPPLLLLLLYPALQPLAAATVLQLSSPLLTTSTSIAGCIISVAGNPAGMHHASCIMHHMITSLFTEHAAAELRRTGLACLKANLERFLWPTR
jgi:predicted outer membrane repeat protein